MSRTAGDRPTLRAIWGRSLAVWMSMLLLLLVAAVSAYLPLGSFNVPIMLGCAAVEVVLVAVFGMELISSGPLLWLAAASGVLWLVIMFALTLNEYFTRAM